MIYWIAGILLFPLHLIYKIKVVDFDKIQSVPRRIFASNHKGWLDIIILGLVLYPKSIHYLGKIELFKNPLVGFFLRSLKCIPINRANPGPSMVKAPMKVLNNNGSVGIFPSGTRKKTSSYKAGVVLIAQSCSGNIIPVYYDGPGTFKLSHLWKRNSVSIKFFEPINCGIHRDNKSRDEIMDKLSEILN